MHHPNVVLVDPFEDECELYAECLRFSGFDVSVRNPDAALEHSRRQAPDAIVTRIRQPGNAINGIELTRAIKTHPVTRDAVVIVITTSLAPHDRIAATNAGCDLYLVLPTDPQELVHHISRLLHARSAARDAR